MFRQPLICDKAQDQDIFPSDIWKEIFQLLNKKELRETAQTCKLLYNIIRDYSLLSRTPWPPIDYTRLKANIIFPDTNLKISPANEHRFFEFENGDFALAHCNIYLWQLGKIGYKVLKGHSDKVMGMITLNTGCIASYDKKEIRIWDIEKTLRVHTPLLDILPIALLYSNKKLICVYENGETEIYDESLRKIKSHKFNYFDSKVKHAKIHDHELILSHQQNKGTWITVCDLEAGKLKKTFDLKSLDKLIHADNKEPVDLPCTIKTFSPYIIVSYRGEKFLLNTHPEISALLLGEARITKHATLANGNLFVLNETQDGFRISANYDTTINDFIIKTEVKLPENIPGYRIHTIMPDGSIVIIYGEYKHAIKWDFTTQKINPNFKLAKPFPPLIAEYSKSICVRSLPNGDILSWYFHYGSFAIHDGSTGQIKLNKLFNKRLNRHEFKFEKKSQLANGDFVIQYSVLEHIGPQNYINIHRFGLFQEKSKESNQEDSLEPPRKRQKTF